LAWRDRVINHKTAIFRQINKDNTAVHSARVSRWPDRAPDAPPRRSESYGSAITSGAKDRSAAGNLRRVTFRRTQYGGHPASQAATFRYSTAMSALRRRSYRSMGSTAPSNEKPPEGPPIQHRQHPRHRRSANSSGHARRDEPLMSSRTPRFIYASPSLFREGLASIV
jgi:hypothetical protein